MKSSSLPRCLAAVFAVFLLLPAVALPLSIVDQNQHLGRFIGKTYEPLRVVFDGPVDPGSLSGATFWVTTKDDGATLAGSLSLDETYVANDTVVFTPPAMPPDSRYFDMGTHYLLHVTNGLTGGGVPFDDVFPLGREFVPNIPKDYEIPVVREYSFDDIQQVIDDLEDLLIESNMLATFDPNDPEGTDLDQYWTYPGCSATEAWKITTGHPGAIIAVIDNGVDDLDDPELVDHYFLNRGELPQPDVAGTPCDEWDCNGDGRFNWQDYAGSSDSRLAPYVPDTKPSALLEAFGDGVDDDGNGLPDDVMGWDFYRGVPEALGVPGFPEGQHGGDRAHDAASQADNGRGGKPGVCPDCTVLPIRVGDAVITDFNIMGRAAQYANAMGAQIIIVANGTYNYSKQTDAIFEEMYRKGTLTIAASGDELGYHHIYPAHGEFAMSIKAALPIPNITVDDLNLDFLTFLESYCTNYGAHTSVTAPTGACSSHATAITGGAAGLIVSRAIEIGLNPALTSNELMQLLQMTTDDLKSRCFTFTVGGCKEGWDQHWGYGRINVLRALQWLGDPDKGVAPRIPPEVEITSPDWFENFYPSRTPTLDIEGRIFARGDPYTYEVLYAPGVEPDDDEFILLEEGSGTAETQGTLATLDLTSIFTEDYLAAAHDDANARTVTLKVRATKYVDSEAVPGEYRKAIAVYHDFDEETGLLPGFPIAFEGSGESSVVLWDLEGDGGPHDIVFGGGDGLVRAYRYSESSGTWEMAPGFPVDLNLPDNQWEDSILGSVAVGPLFGDEVPYIVAVTYAGRVFAVHPNGNLHVDAGGEPDPFLPGFPVEAEKNPPYPNREFAHGNVYLASPVLADLDLDGVLEIITANFNLNVYAFKPAREGEGEVELLSGWPVRTEATADNVDPDKVCDHKIPASILTSPAVAILDPANLNPDVAEYPAVIVATSEVCTPPEGDDDDDDDDVGGLPDLGLDTGRVYAIHHDGYDNPDGPFVEGFPAEVIAPFGDAIPIPPLTVGVTSSPAVAHEQGQTVIGTGTFLFPPQLMNWEDGELQYGLAISVLHLGASANGTFAHVGPNGRLNYFVPTVGLNLANTLETFILENFQVSGFDVGAAMGLVFDGWLDDVDFFVNPVVGDISGDGAPEVICGSSGYMLRAYDFDGNQPEDWPKFTQHFITAAPALGDLDGDGLLEVVLADHEGSLWAWNTRGQACGPSGGAAEWYRWRHDEYNSGFLNNDVRPPAPVTDLAAERSADDSGRVTITLTAPGDDWGCGFAGEWDIRYATSDSVDLTDPAEFQAASKVDLSELGDIPFGGTEASFEAAIPGAVKIAMRAADPVGNRSTISNEASITTADGDDDDTGGDDDDDDDEGCGCN